MVKTLRKDKMFWLRKSCQFKCVRFRVRARASTGYKNKDGEPWCRKSEASKTLHLFHSIQFIVLLTWQWAVFYFQLIFNSADHTSAQLQFMRNRRTIKINGKCHLVCNFKDHFLNTKLYTFTMFHDEELLLLSFHLDLENTNECTVLGKNCEKTCRHITIHRK